MASSSSLTLAGLTAQVVEPHSPASAGALHSRAADAATTVVLLHGFGAPGDDLVALADMFDAPVRLVFPAGPLALGGGYGNARAWWMIDFARIEQQLARGIDRTTEIPDGLQAARAQLAQFLDELVAKFAIAPGRLVLGGFSQGAMLSLDAALHRAQPVGGLIMMSGTLIAASEWLPRMAALAGVPVLMTHGRADPLLPFATAETLRDHIRAAGADLEWLPFNGGHTIPAPALAAVAHFLRARAA